MNTRRIGIVIYDGVTALDVAGPMDAFASAAIGSGGKVVRCYEVVALAAGRNRACTSESGLRLGASTTLTAAPPLDTVIVPGGSTLRTTRLNEVIAAWISQHSRSIRRIASVCTGVFALAPTGLLDGRRITTHWRYAQELATRFPKLSVDPDAIYLKDGKCYTSAGITAGIDLSLALIEEDLGPRAALQVARELVVYCRRAGGQQQYSEPLRFQAQNSDAFADLIAWIGANLAEDLSVESLAARVHLGARQFTRRLQAATGHSPAAFVERLRLTEARMRLALPRASVEAVGVAVGYRSADAFRRAFQRRFGVSPSDYRRGFFG